MKGGSGSKGAATSEGRQYLLTSLRRFYSNAYSDRWRQDAMNLFLGNWRPDARRPQIWELQSDWLLHQGPALLRRMESYRQVPEAEPPPAAAGGGMVMGDEVEEEVQGGDALAGDLEQQAGPGVSGLPEAAAAADGLLRPIRLLDLVQQQQEEEEEREQVKRPVGMGLAGAAAADAGPATPLAADPERPRISDGLGTLPSTPFPLGRPSSVHRHPRAASQLVYLEEIPAAQPGSIRETAVGTKSRPSRSLARTVVRTALLFSDPRGCTNGKQPTFNAPRTRVLPSQSARRVR